MSEFDTGAAPAAAEPSTASNEQVVQTPNPIRTDSQPAAKEPSKPEDKPSARDAIARARDKVAEQEKADAASKPVKSEAAKGDPAKAGAKEADKVADRPAPKVSSENRDDGGRYKGKDAVTEGQQPPAKVAEASDTQQQKPRYEAPKRFSSDVAASADWAKTPESVQAAVHRVQREMEDGITKYKTSHDRYETFREIDEIAKSNGHELRQSLDKVVAIEQAFARNPVEGFQRICDHFGLNMRQLAAHIAGQKPEDVQVQQEGTISELKRELADLKQQISGVSTGFQQQQTAATSKEVEAFASQPEYARFYDIMDDIAFFLKSDKVDPGLPPMDRLKAAYQLADRLNPDPNPKPATTTASASDAVAAKASDANSEALAAQTRKGGKSITGAPNAGEDIADREPSSSVKDSIRRAFAQAG